MKPRRCCVAMLGVGPRPPAASRRLAGRGNPLQVEVRNLATPQSSGSVVLGLIAYYGSSRR